MKRFFLLFTTLFSFTLSAQVLHTIMFTDTQDEEIGVAARVSHDNYSRVFLGTIEKCLGNSYKRKHIEKIGYNCNKTELLEVLDELSCSEEDIVVFIYTGHGARGVDDWSDFPQMCFAVPRGREYRNSNDFFPLENVRDVIVKKKPRFCFIIGDCCNSYSNNITTKPRIDASTASSTNAALSKRGEEIVRKLFLTERGSVMLTASKKGEYGWCTTKSEYPSQLGMFLERNLTDLFLDIRSGRAEISNWETLLSTISSNTHTYSEGARCETTENGLKKIWTQTPIYRIDFIGKGNGSSVGKTKDAQITNVRVTTEGNVEGEKGISVHVNFSIQNMKGKDGRVSCYFYDSNGNALVDSNEEYCTTNGKVSCGRDIKPGYGDSHYDDFVISIPGSELHQEGEFSRTLMVNVVIWDESVSPSNELCRLDETSFSFTPEKLYLRVNGDSSEKTTRFSPSGGRETYSVSSNASTYEVWGLPSWCTVENKKSTSFTLVCKPNYQAETNTDYFEVRIAGKSVRINIEQEGKTEGAIIRDVSVEHTSRLNSNGFPQPTVKTHVKLEVIGHKGENLTLFFYIYPPNNMFPSDRSSVKLHCDYDDTIWEDVWKEYSYAWLMDNSMIIPRGSVIAVQVQDSSGRVLVTSPQKAFW